MNNKTKQQIDFEKSYFKMILNSNNNYPSNQYYLFDKDIANLITKSGQEYIKEFERIFKEHGI